MEVVVGEVMEVVVVEVMVQVVVEAMEEEGVEVMEEFIEALILSHLITTMTQLTFRMQADPPENEDQHTKVVTEEVMEAVPRFHNRNATKSPTKPPAASVTPWTSPRATALHVRSTSKSAVTCPAPAVVKGRPVNSNVTRFREKFPV